MILLNNLTKKWICQFSHIFPTWLFFICLKKKRFYKDGKMFNKHMNIHTKLNGNYLSTEVLNFILGKFTKFVEFRHKSRLKIDMKRRFKIYICLLWPNSLTTLVVSFWPKHLPENVYGDSRSRRELLEIFSGINGLTCAGIWFMAISEIDCVVL